MASVERASFFRHEGHVFFIYDHTKKTEEDDPKDAILYFYPGFVEVDVQIALVGGIIGLVDFCLEFLPQSMPRIVKLSGRNFALLQHEDFIIGLGGSPDTPDACLTAHMQFVWSTFVMYQGSLYALKKRVSGDNFLQELKNVWDYYLPLRQIQEDTLSQAFQVLPYVQLHKSQGHLFLHASHILQRSLTHKGVLAGALFNKTRVLCTQLSNSLTRQLLLLMSQSQFPCVEANSVLELPGGVKLLHIYLPRNEYAGLGYRRKKAYIYPKPGNKSKERATSDSVNRSVHLSLGSPDYISAQISFTEGVVSNTFDMTDTGKSESFDGGSSGNRSSNGGEASGLVVSPVSGLTSGTDSEVFLDTLSDMIFDSENQLKLADIKQVECATSSRGTSRSQLHQTSSCVDPAFIQLSSNASLSLESEKPSPSQDGNSPSLRQDVSSPSLGQDVSSPSLSQDSRSPSLRQDVSSPSLSQDSNSPSPRQDVSSPSLSQDSSSPSPRQDVSSPSLSQDSSSPSLRQDVSSPSPSQQSSSPSLRQDVSSPSLGQDVSSPSLSQDSRSPSLRQDVSSPSLSQESSSPSPRQHNSSPPSQQSSSPSPSQDFIRPLTQESNSPAPFQNSNYSSVIQGINNHSLIQESNSSTLTQNSNNASLIQDSHNPSSSQDNSSSLVTQDSNNLTLTQGRNNADLTEDDKPIQRTTQTEQNIRTSEVEENKPQLELNQSLRDLSLNSEAPEEDGSYHVETVIETPHSRSGDTSKHASSSDPTKCGTNTRSLGKSTDARAQNTCAEDTNRRDTHSGDTSKQEISAEDISRMDISYVDRSKLYMQITDANSHIISSDKSAGYISSFDAFGTATSVHENGDSNRWNTYYNDSRKQDTSTIDPSSNDTACADNASHDEKSFNEIINQQDKILDPVLHLNKSKNKDNQNESIMAADQEHCGGLESSVNEVTADLKFVSMVTDSVTHAVMFTHSCSDSVDSSEAGTASSHFDNSLSSDHQQNKEDSKVSSSGDGLNMITGSHDSSSMMGTDSVDSSEAGTASSHFDNSLSSDHQQNKEDSKVSASGDGLNMITGSHGRSSMMGTDSGEVNTSSLFGNGKVTSPINLHVKDSKSSSELDSKVTFSKSVYSNGEITSELRKSSRTFEDNSAEDSLTSLRFKDELEQSIPDHMRKSEAGTCVENGLSNSASLSVSDSANEVSKSQRSPQPSELSKQTAFNVTDILAQNKEQIDASMEAPLSGDESSTHSSSELKQDDHEVSYSLAYNEARANKDRLTLEFADSEFSEGGLMSPASMQQSPGTESSEPTIDDMPPGRSGSEPKSGDSKTTSEHKSGDAGKDSPEWDPQREGLEELTLYAQGHSDTLLVLLVSHTVKWNKLYINSLWKSCLPHLAELDFQVKDAERHAKDESENVGAQHQYLKYDSFSQNLKGTALLPVTSLANEIVDSSIRMHESFSSMPGLQEITYRSHSACCYAQRMVNTETFFQIGMPRMSAGICPPNDKTFCLDQMAEKILQNDK